MKEVEIIKIMKERRKERVKMPTLDGFGFGTGIGLDSRVVSWELNLIKMVKLTSNESYYKVRIQSVLQISNNINKIILSIIYYGSLMYINVYKIFSIVIKI